MAQQIVMSMSFPNAGATPIPGTPSLTGAAYTGNGPDRFEVGQYDSYSYHVFLTGSNVNGTLYHLVSNNCVGFSAYQQQALNASNLSQDIVFGAPQNISQYASLYYSGSGAGQLTASVVFYGRRFGGRNV
jgi:hypothetical protein